MLNDLTLLQVNIEMILWVKIHPHDMKYYDSFID